MTNTLLYIMVLVVMVIISSGYYKVGPLNANLPHLIPKRITYSKDFCLALSASIDMRSA